METPPPPPQQQQPRKRGRPKGSTNKPKEDRERDSHPSGGATSRKRGGAGGGKKAGGGVDEKYAQWKSLVPVLYDWFANHNLVWPSLSCRWGPVIEQHSHKNCQRLYLSEQTDQSAPNTLIIANCDVVRPRIAAENHIAHFNEEARSPYVKKYKTIIHPGEVNRIRELPQNKNIVATHTDSPEVLIWDIEAQPNRQAVLGAAVSLPDLTLTGHQDNAEFALAMCPIEPFVLSGGKDKYVVLWSIQDHISTLATDTQKSVGSAGSSIMAVNNPSIGARGIFQGHEDTVEDVQFCPSSSQEFCSVGDDSCLILWDARVGPNPAVKVEKAHNADLHCVDWNPHDDNLIITGSADNSVCLFDRRSLTSNGVGSPIHIFQHHKAAVLCVQWSPDKSSVFGSCAEDGRLNIWDYEKVGEDTETPAAGLFFQHAGHRDKVVDFQWNASDPWTIVSVSDDCDSTGRGGGTLQIWRMLDLLYRPKEEALAELQRFKDHISNCTSYQA
ncbi:WD-40 repeat-containing protein MSI4-like [Ipomoea triloba]|uniref:WD-40 repeat-containing protein MSI4-like n=1 Tax=Ipomoea triloba TaxID=35885 RepID=UPI00125E1F1A|nr:WD-40 repeat-containing protein MSI4-like [Ipomoea triloba]